MVVHEKLGKMFDVQDILAALQKQTGLTKQDTQKLPRVRLAGLIQEMRCKWLHPWTCHKSHFEFSSGKSMRELLWKVRSAVGGACRHHHRLHHHLAETVLFSMQKNYENYHNLSKSHNPFINGLLDGCALNAQLPLSFQQPSWICSNLSSASKKGWFACPSHLLGYLKLRHEQWRQGCL